MGLLSRLETLHVEGTLLIWKELGFPMDWFPNAGKFFAPKLRDVEMDLKTDFDAASNKE